MTTSLPDDALDRSVARAERIAMTRIADLQTFVVTVSLLVAILYLFSDVLLLLFAAILLACQLTGLARFISHRSPLSYMAALVATVLGITALFAAFFYFLGPRVAAEFQAVYNDVRDQIATLWTSNGHADWVQHAADRVRSYVDSKGGNLAGQAASFVSSTIGNLGSVALIVVGAIYFAISPGLYRDGTLKLLPPRHRQRTGDILVAEAHTLRRWFVGQLVDMAAIGAMTMLGLWALGMPLFFTLGCIAALCNFVPYLGALAGSVPAIFIALGQSPTLAIYVAILFAVVQAIEGNVISPVISKRTVDLPPVLTLFAQTVLGSLFGPFGLIFATPIVAAGLVMVRTLYVEDTLGDPSP